MTRFTAGLAIDTVCITYHHADDVLGLPGLLHAVEFYDLTRPLEIYTPRGTGSDIETLIDAPGPELSFRTVVTELGFDERVRDPPSIVIETFETEHRTRSIGYRIDTSGVQGERTLV